MKTTVGNLKKLFRGLAEAGHVDRSKRKGRGYDESNIDVDYTDVPELAGEGVVNEIDPGTFDGPPNQGFGSGFVRNPHHNSTHGTKEFFKDYHAEKDPKVKDRMKKSALALGVHPKHFGEKDEGVSQSKRLAHGYDLEQPADYDVPGEGLPMKNESEVPMALRVRLHPTTPADAPQMGPPMDMVDMVPSSKDIEVDMGEMDESTPPGFEKVVKGLKKNSSVDNPWAVAWSMKDKGDKPKENKMPSLKSVLKKR